MSQQMLCASNETNASNVVTDELVQAAAPVLIPQPVTSTFHILNERGKEMWANFTIDTVSDQVIQHNAMPCFEHVFEHESLRVPSGIRPLLYEMTPMVSMYARFECLPYEIQALFRRCVALSTVCICTPRSSTPTMEEVVMVIFMEFGPEEELILLDGYFITRAALLERANAYLVNRCIPKPNPYNPALHKFPVLLDLDKTLIITYDDTQIGQSGDFVESGIITGRIAISGAAFTHRIMIRKGAHELIKAILPFAEISVITAGDIHYGRAIVYIANQLNWLQQKDETVTDSVTIPLQRVFSVRNQLRTAQKKQLNCALPCFESIPGSFVAVDDDPAAWEVSARNHVIPVAPFQPSFNSPDVLLSVIPMIKERMQTYLKVQSDEIRYD